MTYSDDTAWAANTYEDGEVKKRNLEKLKTEQEQPKGMKNSHFLHEREKLTLFIGASFPTALSSWDFVRERAEILNWVGPAGCHVLMGLMGHPRFLWYQVHQKNSQLFQRCHSGTWQGTLSWTCDSTCRHRKYITGNSVVQRVPFLLCNRVVMWQTTSKKYYFALYGFTHGTWVLKEKHLSKVPLRNATLKGLGLGHLQQSLEIWIGVVKIHIETNDLQHLAGNSGCLYHPSK